MRNLHDGTPVFRTVYLCCAEPSETGGILFPVPQGDHCDSADPSLSDDWRAGDSRCVLGRAGIQCDRGDGKLCDHADYGMADIETDRK